MTDTPGQQPEDPFAKWVPVIDELRPKIETECRRLGLYIMDIGMLSNPRQTPFGDELPPVIVANFTIGDVAFSDRVQNPVEGRMDAEFKKLESQMTKQEFEDLREKMQKALQEGRNPFELNDDEKDDGSAVT